MNLWMQKRSKKVGWIDFFILALFFLFLFGVIGLGAGMRAPFVGQSPEMDLNPIHLPYYAGRSLLRMFLAYFASLLFTFIYGRIAASSRLAERILIPIIDILQSVPVLGFLSATVTFFISLFPGSLFGVELASLFAIFTGQVWNMTFSFYHSLTTIPRELDEASRVFGLSFWSKFKKLEVPSSMMGLVWNSMMSFGGGWFFLAASEAITVLGTNIKLPGIGSYMATAVDQGNVPALLYAILTMVLMILLVDQLFWKPVLVWAQKFKVELTEASERPKSFVLVILQRSAIIGILHKKLFAPIWAVLDFLLERMFSSVAGKGTGRSPIKSLIGYVLLVGMLLLLSRFVVEGFHQVRQLGFLQLIHVVWLGGLTLLRVVIATILGAAWTIPIGVKVGLNPKLAKVAQPLAQIAASFPANMLFPFVILFYLKFHINFEIGAIPLMMLGTQWYILFNVIAGAMAIPTDLQEASDVFGLTKWTKWKKLILPGIFPYIVTGGVTAMGGAWNASIVSEIVSWKSDTLQATGLGTYIAQATANGNWAGIIWGILVMCMFVVLINRLLWRRLYKLAETKYRIA